MNWWNPRCSAVSRLNCDDELYDLRFTICEKSYVLSLKSQQSIKHLNSDGEQLVGEIEVRVVQGRLLCAGADAEERPRVVLCQQAEILASREGLLFRRVFQSALRRGFSHFFHRLGLVLRGGKVFFPYYIIL